MNEDRPYQLRDAAEMIRKSEDSQKVVKGLEILPNLIEAAPDELANYSGKRTHNSPNATDFYPGLSGESEPSGFHSVPELGSKLKGWN